LVLEPCYSIYKGHNEGPKQTSVDADQLEHDHGDEDVDKEPEHDIV